MAEPTEFKEQNFVYAKPRNMSSEDCGDLPCHIHESTGTVISKWELTAAELEEVNASGCVFVGTLSIPPPPIWVSGLSPFAKSESAPKGDRDYSEFVDLVRHAAKYAFFLSATEGEALDVDELRELSKALKGAIDTAKTEAIKEMVGDD